MSVCITIEHFMMLAQLMGIVSQLPQVPTGLWMPLLASGSPLQVPCSAQGVNLKHASSVLCMQNWGHWEDAEETRSIPPDSKFSFRYYLSLPDLTKHWINFYEAKLVTGINVLISCYVSKLNKNIWICNINPGYIQCDRPRSEIEAVVRLGSLRRCRGYVQPLIWNSPWTLVELITECSSRGSERSSKC